MHKQFKLVTVIIVRMSNFNRGNRSERGGGFRRGGFGGRSSDRGPITMHSAICDNCGNSCEVPFRPTSGKPVFCSTCFEKKGDSSPRRPEGRNFERSGSDRPMFDAVCDDCGNSCKVPFQPKGDKPIYCSNCFGKINEGGERITRSAPMQNNQQLEEVNAKLDRILKLLSPNISKEAATEEKPKKEIDVPRKKSRVTKKTTSA